MFLQVLAHSDSHERFAVDGEDGLEEQELQRIAGEHEEWRKHVVVEDTTFYTAGPRCSGQVRVPS